ncbi:MAG TPA: amidohydrolase [Actinomycetota bacterium]
MASQDASNGPAEVVVFAGRVFSAERGPDAAPADSVAIRGGRIAAVGTRADLRARVGPRTEVVDLPDATVLPGFQDAHVHPPSSGLELLQCNLHDVHAVDDYVAVVRDYAAAHPDRPWVLGGGWSLDSFPGGIARRSLLDAVVPDRPAYLPNRDYHGAWVNSAALRAAGIDRDTPDPPDGRIERDSDGEPSGTLHEGAMDMVGRHAPRTTPAEWEAGLLTAQAHLHSLGITAWQDAWLRPENLDTYLALAADGRLTARVAGCLWWERDRGLEQVDDLVERRARGRAARLRCDTVKVMQDGVCENFSAAMLEPYLGAEGRDAPAAGISFVEAEALKAAVSRLDSVGFQVHFHAIGDRAVRECLDAVEAARSANGVRDARHHIAHIQLIHPDDVPRFAALDVVPNCQPYWACLDDQMRDLNVPFLGPERSRTQYPFRSLVAAGARLAMGSDWSVSTADPLAEIQVAMTRVPQDTPDREPFLPDERLDLATCLEAFTLGSAYVNRLDDVTGTLEPGKFADLAVVDRDLFELVPNEVGDARCLLTMVEGEVVYRAAV